MEKESLVYILPSVSVAIFAVISAIIAERAMRRGLTYSAFVSVVWTLMVFAVARIWHVGREVFDWKAEWGEWPEIIEYFLYLVAYVGFILLNTAYRKLERRPFFLEWIGKYWQGQSNGGDKGQTAASKDRA